MPKIDFSDEEHSAVTAPVGRTTTDEKSPFAH
jgi:hypothetical protein